MSKAKDVISQRALNYNNLYPNMGQRSRSKDSIPLSNNLRDVYKNMGVKQVVEAGRIES